MDSTYQFCVKHGTGSKVIFPLDISYATWFFIVDFVRPHDPGHGGLFEALAIRLKIGIDKFCLIALYRPGSEQTTSLFFEEMIFMLEFITMSEAHVVLMGGFNIHAEKRDSPFTLRLHELVQLIDPCSVYLDDSYVGVRVALNQVRPKLVKACIRPWKDLNEKCFVEALANFPVANNSQSDDVDYEFAVFSGEIEQISDKVPMRILQFFENKIARKQQMHILNFRFK
ncbi:hypothetical protein HELRODRAFT_178617 [Helobdella robusta]|uniref:Endonuclease/exonuclease/phosphatase domain-containing protein n=1 Tax=Helobdella robusta TaxID=6412 RepID=T1FDG6_HELRO|nr:hypothetical protein HELRODRAFT_178617 [Helobdella robusta]ESN96822.1 hypothetical protein HELRODRAFT_178617 [Helobdella robusta]